MRFRRKTAIALGMAMPILLILSATVAASPGWMQRVGTIGHALTLQDGSYVYLDAVEISKIRSNQTPSYIVIAECFSARDRIIVLTQPSPLLRMGQTVDIEGDLITLDSGGRAITNATVWGYADGSGTLLYHGPLIKGLDAPLPWDYKVDLTVAPSMSRSEAPSQSGEVSTDSSFNMEYCSTIAAAKAKDVGTVVELRCKPISSVGSGYFMLGQDGSSDTLKTFYTGTVSSSARVAVVRGTIDTDGTDPVLDVDSGPNYDVQQSYPGSVLTASEGTIAWIKTWADGHTFSSGDITGKIITRNWTDYLYIEDDTRACGIRVEKTAHGHLKDEVVSVVGTLATNSDDERYIAATTITQTDTGSLNPLGMNNKWLGGGDFAYDPGPPVSGQRGITDAAGLNNIGLLVRTWGKVTEIDTANPPQWFRIYDGSNVQTTVAYPPYGYALDDYVSMSGISSCEVDTNDDLQRVLRPQPLAVTINQATGQSDPTNSAPISFTVIFSEPATDFDDSGDVSITGTAGGTKTVTITQTDSEGKEYSVAVSSLTYGTVIAAVPAGKAQNNSGVWNYASTSTDDTVAYCDGIVYVQTPANGGSDSNSGWRWDNAKATVGAALTTAVTYGQTQVWVAKGTYNERITLPAGKALYGGFVGTESTLGQRPAFPRSSPDSNETVLDGQHGGNVVTATSTNVYNTVDGFTIQHGTSYGITASSVLTIYNCKLYSSGTGIRMTANSIIDSNEITYNTNNGIYLSTSSGGTVSANKINHNTNNGIYCDGGSGYTINRNSIEYNNTGNSYAGGGICFSYCSGTPTVANNFIRGNGATKGGGIYCGGTALNVYNNTIVDNSCSTSNNGAGICVRNTGGNPEQSVYVCNNIVANNTNGYGMYIDNINLNYNYTVYLTKNCSFQNSSGHRAVSGYNATFAGTGNELYNSPGLSADRCHLASGSQCINAGWTYDWDDIRCYGSYDIDGNARVINSLIDVGCDEVQ